MNARTPEEYLAHAEETERLDIIEAVIGRKMENDLGEEHIKYLLERAVDYVTVSRSELEVVDPGDEKEIRRLQNQCNVGRMFLKFVGDALAQGAAAERRIYEREEEFNQEE